MFYLSGRGNFSGDSKFHDEDEFGWYLGNPDVIEERIYKSSSQSLRSSRRASSVKKLESTANGDSSLKSTISIFTCNDCNGKSTNYSLSPEFTKRQNDEDDSTRNENIEMNSLRIQLSKGNHDIDLDMIERDADNGIFTSSKLSNGESEDSNQSQNLTSHDHPRGFCYTPERLVRSQQFRILTPSPRFLVIPRNTANDGDGGKNRNYRGHRRKIGDLIDAKQIGASHLEALLDSRGPEISLPVASRRRTNRATWKKNYEPDRSNEFYEPLEIANRESPDPYKTPELVSSTSSYERLNICWEDKFKVIRRPSQEDTSGVHSNDGSTNTPSDIQTPQCLCDELATASQSFSKIVRSRNRTTAINEVVSILEGLEEDPSRAEVLLEEHRFYEVTSGHDNLTRLALAIEPDGSVPTDDDNPGTLIVELREKIERLQGTTRNILKDIHLLRQDFQFNESKVDDLIEATITLRQDANEMRYLDDLLNLLDGELERISRRNWPFIFGQEHRAEEMNLVV